MMGTLRGVLGLTAAVLGVCALGKDSEVIVGNIRVQALSSTLVRIEPVGPRGFEDRTTFMVVNRSFAGIPIKRVSTGDGAITLKTASYSVVLRGASNAVQPTCQKPLALTDVDGAERSPKYPHGQKVSNSTECCRLCDEDQKCALFVFSPSSRQCWPLSAYNGLVRSASDREVGCSSRGVCGAPSGSSMSFYIEDTQGNVLYDAEEDKHQARNMLHWPSPRDARGYAVVDFPRFFAPAWGVSPIPSQAHVDPALLATHGYDFRNNVNGDTYVFLFGQGHQQWSASREEFLQLTGPVPLLPDYAYGTWFTWWTAYTESMAKSDIQRWEKDKLPIDIWALDMNWRHTHKGKDHYYNYPNTKLFPNFTEFFQYLSQQRLRTYFNDHPFPVASRGAGGLQTSKEETAFRWNGLSEWMARGLTFWWFDHNWRFSIPPPFVNTSHTDGNWYGLDNAAWGSHVYYTSVEQFDLRVREPAGDHFYGRPVTLTKFARPDWRSGMDPHGHEESPAHHRYPVWWTGDGVDVQASVESMVDAGVHDLKPFVHSDCGGDGRFTAGSLLRWTAHCVFGSILRFHGSDHRPWTWGTAVEDTIRSYLNMRYKMLPSLIAAGHEATKTGFPLAARCDLFYPDHVPDSSSNRQYIFLGEVLVAPMFDSKQNVTSRSVWIPPGDWQDAWDGSVVSGPRFIEAQQPYERQPMWHRRGGLLVLADAPTLRVEEQDWSTLTLEAFPSATERHLTRRSVHERSGGAAAATRGTDLELETDGRGAVELRVGAAANGAARSWVARFHLRPGQRATALTVDGVLANAQLQHLEATGPGAHFLPLAGAGSAPAPLAGPVAELRLDAAAHARVVQLRIVEAVREVVV